MENEKQLEKTKDNKKRNSTLASKESEQPFHNKYRPKSFEEFLGNEPMVKSLKSLLEKKGPSAHLPFHRPQRNGEDDFSKNY